MGLLMALIFLLLPIAELAVLIAVGQEIGVGPTILLLIAVSVAGAFLAKREGLEIWRRFRATVAAGQIPSSEVVDGFLILFGAALLLTPGFITDLLGLLLLFPPSRAWIRRGLRRGGGLLLFKRFPFMSGIALIRPTSSQPRRAKVVQVEPSDTNLRRESGAGGPPPGPSVAPGEET